MGLIYTLVIGIPLCAMLIAAGLVSRPAPAISTSARRSPVGCRSSFEALIWKSQTIPNVGVNAERATVTDVEGDVLTLVRGDPPILVTRAYQIGAVDEIPIYAFLPVRRGEPVDLLPSTLAGVASAEPESPAAARQPRFLRP